jgi:hypothetical protein
VAGAARRAALPKLFDLRADPFERAQMDAGDYARWRVERAFLLVRTGLLASICDLQDFPPRQKPGSLARHVLEKLRTRSARGDDLPGRLHDQASWFPPHPRRRADRC